MKIYQNFAQAREANPKAAIIRHIGKDQWIAFRDGSDAIGHPSTQVFKGSAS